MDLIKDMIMRPGTTDRNFIRVTIDIYPGNYTDDKSNIAAPVPIKAPEMALKAPQGAPLIAPEMAPKAPLIAPKPADIQPVHTINKHVNKHVDTTTYDASSSDTEYDPKIEDDMPIFTPKRKKTKKFVELKASRRGRPLSEYEKAILNGNYDINNKPDIKKMKEIANVLDRPVGTIRSWFSRKNKSKTV